MWKYDIVREPLNKSAAAVSGSFAPTDRFENFEIHKVFLQFPNLNLETKSLADHSCDLIRGSLEKQSFLFDKKIHDFLLIIRPTPEKTYLMGESAFRSDKGGEQHG